MMQEIRHDGSERVTERATPWNVRRAMRDRRNRQVSIFRPGERFTSWSAAHNHRALFEVRQDGTIKYVGPAPKAEPAE